MDIQQKIGAVTLLVGDYDEALEFYIAKLGFKLIEDTDLGNSKRWVLIAPAGSNGTCLLLAKANSPEQEEYIGRQSGGRVFLFLHTDDFGRDYSAMKKKVCSF